MQILYLKCFAIVSVSLFLALLIYASNLCWKYALWVYIMYGTGYFIDVYPFSAPIFFLEKL